MKKLLVFSLAFICCGQIKSQVAPTIDWIQNYHETNSLEHSPTAIDANNNVYVTGYSYPGSTKDITTIKYSPVGTQLWVSHYDNGGIDAGHDVKVDAAGNVYVAGESDGSGTGRDYVVVKYSPVGVQLWVARYNGTGNGADVANALVLDPAGNVYVTGKSTGISSGFDYATVCFTSAGTQLWASTYNGSGNGTDNAVAIDFGAGAPGKVYITGTALGASSGDDIVTRCINSLTGAPYGPRQ